MPTYTRTRRQLIGSLSVSLASTVWPGSSALGIPAAGAQTSGSSPLPAEVLPKAVRSRFLNGINGLRMHVLEAGFETPDSPGVLLVHGFPELAFSWRRIMPGQGRRGRTDAFQRRARREGYRARSVYKLMDIQKRS